MRRHAFRLLHHIEADEGDLHGHDAAECVERRVGDVEAGAVSPSHHHNHHIDRDDVDDEHVAAPRRHHVEVSQGL